MKYKILEHTADLKIRFRGNTFTQLLENSALALSHLLLPDKDNGNTTLKLTLNGTSREQMLVRFLNELIFHTQTEYVVFNRFEITESRNAINVVCKGSRIDPSENPEYDFKGVTYHDLKIEENDGILTSDLVIDI